MPTFLVHGFRWQRANIRIHIILQDLEDAAAEWILAPATSVSLLNSFYTLYDFLPPSSPPTIPYAVPPPPPIPTEKPLLQEELLPPRTLTKKNKGSMSSLRSLGRKHRPSNVATKPSNLGKGVVNGNGDGKKSEESRATSASTATSISGNSAPATTKKLAFNDWSVVKLLEQYDPDDMYATSQPYAYVGDYMVEVGLSASITEEMAKYEAKVREEGSLNGTPGSSAPGTPGTANIGNSGDLMSPGLSARDVRRISRRLGWFEKLRDGLQKGTDIGWYVVVCGDMERTAPSVDLPRTSEESEESPQRTPRSAGLKGFFSKRKNIVEEQE